MGQEVLVHGLVYHSGYLAVAAKGQSAYAVLRVSFLERKELDSAYVKKEEELLYLYPENARPEEMPRLMYNNKEGQRKYYL